MATALLGLGSNLGDRAPALEKAIELLKAEPQIRVEAVSRFYPSKPAGGPEGQGEFLNAAARLETSLPPEELLARLLAIEDQIGRVREERSDARVIDLDLLLYDRVEMKTPTLELPHPRLCYRRFVLEPAAEIAGEMVWPVNGWSVQGLARNLDESTKYAALYDPGGLAGCEKILQLAALHGPLQVVTKPNMFALSTEYRSQHPEADAVTWLNEVYLEVIRRASDLLERAVHIGIGTWTVTDFWLEDLIELSPLPWLDRDRENKELLRQSARRIACDAVPPRLLLVVEADFWKFQFGSNAEQIRATWSSGSKEWKSQVAQLRESWDTYWDNVRSLTRTSNAPPSYWLSDEDHQSLSREVLAAMQAME